MTRRLLFATHGAPDPATAVFKALSRRADYLRRLGYAVDIVTPADFVVGRWPRLYPLLLPLAIAIRNLRHYDVVVYHSYLAWAHFFRPTWSFKKRPATIVSFHGLEPLYHKAVEAELGRTGERLSLRFRLLHTVLVPAMLRFACRRADRVFCLNRGEKEFLVANEWAESTQVEIVPNGVADDLLIGPRQYDPLARRILFTGQWLRGKGIRYLAAAFDRIADMFPDCELTCLGTGADRETVLREFAARHHHRIRVLPRVNVDELAAELLRADLFLFPSLSEGFSAALIEAMASGLPVIATPAGAAADLLTNDVNGLLVPFADPHALVDAAVRVIPDASRREALGAAARATARRYEMDECNEMMATELHRVLVETE